MRRRYLDEGVDDNTLLLLHFNNSLKDEVSGTSYSGDNYTYSASGKFSNCISFLGNGQITINNTNAINESLYPDYTIDFWLYLKSRSSGIMSKGVGDGGYSFDLTVEDDGRIFFGIQYNSNRGNAAVHFTIPRDQWVHPAIVRQNSRYWKVYVNGIYVNGFTSTIVSGYYSSLIIGKYRDYGRYLNGYIDEFRISNIARWTSNFQVPEIPY